MSQPSVFPRANDWRMASVWTETIGNKPERPVQERSRIWASELGKPAIEIFLKMRGVEPTNPPNQRAKRKFVAGNFFERFVGYILQNAGILKEAQKWVGFEYPNLLQVSGKIDFIAGGIPDYDGWKTKLTAAEQALAVDVTALVALVTSLQAQLGSGIDPVAAQAQIDAVTASLTSEAAVAAAALPTTGVTGATGA